MNGEEIKDLVIPNSVTSIGQSAFSGFTSLTSVAIPNSVTSIGDFAFYGCSSLISVVIPNSVTSIGNSAFRDCSRLTSVAIPNSVTNIGDCAFWECTGLTSVTIPNGVTSIGSHAFESCSGLTSVTIPNSVTSINERAFDGCSGLTSVTIPNSVTSIGKYAFYGCSGLTSVTCLAENVPATESNAFNNSNIGNATLHVPVASLESYKNTEPWKNFKDIVKIDMPKHTLTYMVGEEVYKTYEIEEGEAITPEPAPTKEGHTFSGWSEIPETMPAHDVTVTGTFSINKYKLTYKVDGETYKVYDVEYGATITALAAPTKEGYTFSGWSWIPSKMPAEDVTITGSFSKNKYKLKYVVDEEVIKSYDIEYGASITAEAEPTKEGYTFSGWSEIPETMPAHDVTVTGTFTINKYKLTYTVDGEEYKSYEVEYGAAITPEGAPTKEGHTFSGWSEIPETMPAHDVTVTGTFTINKYKVTYKVGDVVIATEDVEYGATIVPPTTDSEGNTINWNSHPTTMPAYDITIYGTYATGIAGIDNDDAECQYFTLDGQRIEYPRKGVNIVRMSDGAVKKIIVK